MWQRRWVAPRPATLAGGGSLRVKAGTARFRRAARRSGPAQVFRVGALPHAQQVRPELTLQPGPVPQLHLGAAHVHHEPAFAGKRRVRYDQRALDSEVIRAQPNIYAQEVGPWIALRSDMPRLSYSQRLSANETHFSMAAARHEQPLRATITDNQCAPLEFCPTVENDGQLRRHQYINGRSYHALHGHGDCAAV